MKSCNHSIITASICISLLLFLSGQQQIQAQKEKHLNLWDIRKVLIFRTSINTSVDEPNKKLIEDVNKGGVSFILSAEDEESLKKVGASELLIKAIRENLPEKLRGKLVLYQKYVDNCNKTLKCESVVEKFRC